MPAHKRSSSRNNLHQGDDDHDEQSQQRQQQQHRRKQSRREQPLRKEAQGELRHEDQLPDDERGFKDEQQGNEEDSNEETASDPEELSGFVDVQLFDVRKDVQCPICLGIIKKTRTVMECMHRFCRECIDKSMRLGKNECPACRTHCASRRSLRDDPRFDALIECLYPDIEKYEEEELAFHEEEMARNKQIQESIAQIFRRQSEALIKRRTMGKDAATAPRMRFPWNYRNSYSRRRRNRKNAEVRGSDDNEDENDHDENKDSSSTDELGTENKHWRCRRHAAAQTSQPSPSAANSVGGCIENEMVTSRVGRGSRGSPGLVWNPETLAWGRGGTRSHTRHGSAMSGKGARSNHISRLIDHLQGLQENDNEHVTHETPSRAKDVDMQLVNEIANTYDDQSTINTLMEAPDSLAQVVDQHGIELQILEGCETLAELKASCNSSKGNLILGNRQEETELQKL